MPHTQPPCLSVMCSSAPSLDCCTGAMYRNTVGTVNYMSPEAIAANDEDDGVLKQGRASDVWSLGCILYQMVHGATPFSHLRNIIKKMQAITNENVPINFPPLRNPHLQDVLQRCLQRKAELRPKIPELLQHPLLRKAEQKVEPALGLSVEQLAQLIQEMSAGGQTVSTDALLHRAAKSIEQQQQLAPATPRATPVVTPGVPSGKMVARTACTPQRPSEPAPGAPQPSPFATSRRREMPSTVTRTVLPAPPSAHESSLTAASLPLPVATPPVPPPLLATLPTPPVAMPPAPLARASSLISASELELGASKLKKASHRMETVPRGPPATSDGPMDLVRKAVASRRREMNEDDTMEHTFS